MTINTIQDLFIGQIRHLYNVESQVILTLPGLAEFATSPELKRLLGEQERQCVHQKERLCDIFKHRHSQASGELCQTMKALVGGWKEHVSKTDDPKLRDLVLIGHCNRMSHNKIAAYGFAATLASCLGAVREAGTLAEILDAETAAARRLLRNTQKISAADMRTLAGQS